MLFDPEADAATWTPAMIRRRTPPQPVVPRENLVGNRKQVELEAARRAEELEKAARQKKINEMMLPASRIIAECANEAGISVTEMRAPSGRSIFLTKVRNKAMYRMWRELKFSFPKIGYFFDLDHTSVMYAVGTYAIEHKLPAPNSCKRIAMRLRKVR